MDEFVQLDIFNQYADYVREEFKNRQILLSGIGAPSSIRAPVGAFYLDVSTNDRYEKIGAADDDWLLYTSENAEAAWQHINVNSPIQKDFKFMVDTASAPITITLPSVVEPGDTVWFMDFSGTFSTNNLILDGNGLNIMSSSDPFRVNVSNVYFMMTYTNITVGWKIFPLAD